MKKITVFALSLFTINLAFSQKCNNLTVGTKTLYKPQQQSYKKPPKDYAPVFINHVGRHGARHLTKDVNTSFAYNTLMKADSLNALTTEGKQLKEMVLLLEKTEKKNFKSISTIGKMEQQGVAKRMIANNSAVFSDKNPVVKVKVTKELRTVQSADAFLSGMTDKINTKELTKKVDDTTLRFYDLSPAYLSFEENGSWKPVYANLKKTEGFDEIAQAITKRFFNADYLNKLKAADQDKFTFDLYGFATIINSITKEIQDAGLSTTQLNFESFFTCDQLKTLSKLDEAEDFLVKGPGADAIGIQVKIAATLLVDFINTTDEFIKNKSVNAQLRFTHAEAISPFATLLQITEASKPTNDISNVSKVWHASTVIPLSANIQWILYKKEGNEDYLVKFMLNEKEVAIDGLKTKNFPFYSWMDARAFYLKKLKTLNAALDQRGYTFLQKLN